MRYIKKFNESEENEIDQSNLYSLEEIHDWFSKKEESKILDALESGKLDKILSREHHGGERTIINSLEDTLLIRLSALYHCNGIIKPILNKVNLSEIKKNRIGNLIGSCYTRKNPEVANAVIDHFNPSESQLNDAIGWVKNSEIESAKKRGSNSKSLLTQSEIDKYVADIEKRL